MSNIPQNDKDVKAMLKNIGADNIDNLFKIIPDKYKINVDDLNIDK